MRRLARQIAADYDVRVPEEDAFASALSGGNLQKFVVGRELIKSPQVLVVAQPTWGGRCWGGAGDSRGAWWHWLGKVLPSL